MGRRKVLPVRLRAFYAEGAPHGRSRDGLPNGRCRVLREREAEAILPRSVALQMPPCERLGRERPGPSSAIGSPRGRGVSRGPHRCGRRRGRGIPSHLTPWCRVRSTAVGLALHLGCRGARSGSTGEVGQRATAAGRLEPLCARPRRQPVEVRQRPPGVGRRTDRVAEVAPRPGAAKKAGGQRPSVGCVRRMIADQGFPDRDSPLVGVARLAPGPDGPVGITEGDQGPGLVLPKLDLPRLGRDAAIEQTDGVAAEFDRLGPGRPEWSRASASPAEPRGSPGSSAMARR